MAKKKPEPKPISVEEIVLGRRYIEVTVTMNGHMALKTCVLRFKPIRKHGCLWIQTRGRRRLRTFSLYDFESVSDMGMKRRKSNDHRTFLYNSRNFNLLSRLVRRQQLKEYLTLIKSKSRLADYKIKPEDLFYI